MSPWRPTRREDVTVHELDGEGLVFDARSGDTHRLNTTALFIWTACDGRCEVRDLAGELMKFYDVAFDSALEHVERTLHEFQERSLLAGGERPA